MNSGGMELAVAETQNSSAQQAVPRAAFRLKGMAKRQIVREKENERGDNATVGRRKTLLRESAQNTGTQSQKGANYRVY